MVECESVPVIEANRGFLSFNRYMVECEFAQTMGANYYPTTF